MDRLLDTVMRDHQAGKTKTVKADPVFTRRKLCANIVPADLFRKLDHVVDVLKCQRRKLYMRRPGIHTLCFPVNVLLLQSIYHDYEELPIRIMYSLHQAWKTILP